MKTELTPAQLAAFMEHTLLKPDASPAQTALAMIAAGATRLGTSNGIAIVRGLAGGGNY